MNTAFKIKDRREMLKNAQIDKTPNPYVKDYVKGNLKYNNYFNYIRKNMILTRKYWALSVATKEKENYLKINAQRYLNKTDILILAEKKKKEQNKIVEKLFKELNDFHFFALKTGLESKDQKEIIQRYNEILNALNGIQDYNIKDYTIKVTGRFPTDNWNDIENCLLKLTDGSIQILEPLENNEINFDVKMFRENVKKIIAEQKIDNLFDGLKQYIVAGKCDFIKE